MDETVTGRYFKVFWSLADNDPRSRWRRYQLRAVSSWRMAKYALPPCIGIMRGNTHVFVILKISMVTLPLSLGGKAKRLTKENDRLPVGSDTVM